MAGYGLGTTTAYASLEKTWAHLVAFSCWEQRCISHHLWFSDIPREILHQKEPGCFSVGSMHSDFHSSPGHLLTNEFREWLPTSNRTILFATEIVSSFLWACAQANWNSNCFFVSTVFFASLVASQSIVHKPLTYCPGWNLYTSWLLPISPQWLTRKVSISLRQPDKVVIDSWLTQKKVGLRTPFHKLHQQNVWERLILE